MNLILFGFKKCGKTYYGLKLAQALHTKFIDTDLLIEELYTKIHHHTLSYREIVKKHGFPFFRNLEKHAVSLLAHEKNSVISLGGGVVLDQDNVDRLQKMGTLIYLKTSKKTLKHRILSEDPPSFFDPNHLSDSFENLYRERLPVYENIAAEIIDTHGLTEEQLLNKLVFLAHELKAQKYGKE